jgi:hypothetical protein
LFFIAEDTSLFVDRFNKFTITETSTPDNLVGEVELITEGQYSYTVREQESATNLDPALSGSIVETGKVTVTSEATAVPTYTTESNTIEVYNG